MKLTTVNPLDFGSGHDAFNISTLPVAAPEIIHHDGAYDIASLKPGLDGFRLAIPGWEEPE